MTVANAPALSFSSVPGRWVVAVTVLGSGMAALDATVVDIALPAIGREFHVGVGALQWVMAGYSLALAAFLLIGGSLGDRFGRRRVYLIGVVWFTLASAACGFAPVAGFLIATRVLLMLSARSGRLAARIGPRLQMSVGPIVTGAGLAMLTITNPPRVPRPAGASPPAACLHCGLEAPPLRTNVGNRPAPDDHPLVPAVTVASRTSHVAHGRAAAGGPHRGLAAHHNDVRRIRNGIR